VGRETATMLTVFVVFAAVRSLMVLRHHAGAPTNA
jgi:hypothetical protein